MNRFGNHHFFILTFMTVFLLMLSGCGGGDSTTAPGAVGSATISGTAVKGPIDSGTVRAYAVVNGASGTQLATAVTDSLGNFSMTVQNYAGPVMLIMTGGTYTDEASGVVMTMAANDVMTAVVPTISNGSMITGMQITPLTSMAQARAAHMINGMIAANIDAANTAISNYFMVQDILYTVPINPLVTASGAGASQDMINYGITIAAMTQYAQTIGMTHSSGIVTALMDDASDGIMNGMMGKTSISMAGMGGMMGGTMMQSTAGTTGLANAMTTFMNSSMNQSGLSAGSVQPLITHLSTTSGTF